MKKFYVVAFDISENRRRRKVVKLLQEVGVRVNKSVFECFLSDTRVPRLKAAIEEKIARTDSVLFYNLCRSCLDVADRQGVPPLPVDAVMVF